GRSTSEPMTDRKQSSGSQLHDLVSLYALGALDSEDQLRFEDHLRGGCESCETELRSFGDLNADLASLTAACPVARAAACPGPPSLASSRDSLGAEWSADLTLRRDRLAEHGRRHPIQTPFYGCSPQIQHVSRAYGTWRPLPQPPVIETLKKCSCSQENS